MTTGNENITVADVVSDIMADVNPSPNEAVAVAEYTYAEIQEILYTHPDPARFPRLPVWRVESMEFNRHVFKLQESQAYLPFPSIAAAMGWGAEGDIPLWTFAGEFSQDSYPVTMAGNVPVWTGAGAFGWEASGDIPLWSGVISLDLEGFMSVSGRVPLWEGTDIQMYQETEFSLDSSIPPWTGSAVLLEEGVFTLAKNVPLWTGAMSLYREEYFTLASRLPLWAGDMQLDMWFILAANVPVWVGGGDQTVVTNAIGSFDDGGSELDDYLLIYRRP